MPYKNSEKLKERNKKYYLANKEKWKQYEKKYSKEERKEFNRINYLKNKKNILKKNKEYREINREKLFEYYKKLNATPYRKQQRKKWAKQQRKINPNFKIRADIARRILLALKGKNKSKKTIELLGCTIEELWTHLENKFTEGMTRENHGKWHVDHIMPCASFDLTDPEQQEKCFHYTNLQPLWALDNARKGKSVPIMATMCQE